MDFSFRKNTQGEKCDRNGHVVHRLELHVDGEDNSGGANAFYGDEVGYLSVTYVPSNVWEKRYTGDWGIVRWLADFKGTCGLTDFETITDDEGNVIGTEKWLHKDLRQTVDVLSREVDRWDDWLCNTGELEQMSEEALEAAFDHYTDEVWERHEGEYKASRRFHVDKPRVEFIRVAKPHRRKGYGTALYREMTKQLDRRFGFNLYDGGTQSDEAEAAWEKLITLDWNEASVEEYPPRTEGGFDEGNMHTRYELSLKRETKQLA